MASADEISWFQWVIGILVALFGTLTVIFMAIVKWLSTQISNLREDVAKADQNVHSQVMIAINALSDRHEEAQKQQEHRHQENRDELVQIRRTAIEASENAAIERRRSVDILKEILISLGQKPDRNELAAALAQVKADTAMTIGRRITDR